MVSDFLPHGLSLGVRQIAVGSGVVDGNGRTLNLVTPSGKIPAINFPRENRLKPVASGFWSV